MCSFLTPNLYTNTLITQLNLGDVWRQHSKLKFFYGAPQGKS